MPSPPAIRIPEPSPSWIASLPSLASSISLVPTPVVDMVTTPLPPSAFERLTVTLSPAAKNKPEPFSNCIGDKPS